MYEVAPGNGLYGVAYNATRPAKQIPRGHKKRAHPTIFRQSEFIGSVVILLVRNETRYSG